MDRQHLYPPQGHGDHPQQQLFLNHLQTPQNLLNNTNQLSGGMDENADQLMGRQTQAPYRQMLNQMQPGANNFSYAANGQY